MKSYTACACCGDELELAIAEDCPGGCGAKLHDSCAETHKDDGRGVAATCEGCGHEDGEQ